MDIKTVCCLFFVFFSIGNAELTEDKDPCNPNPCKYNNTCIRSDSSFTCECKPIYTGEFCNTELDLCYENPCENGGSCTIESEDFKCDCIKPYTGRKCENEIVATKFPSSKTTAESTAPKNDEDYSTSKSESSTVSLMGSTDHIGLNKTTETVDPRTEESTKITTESVISSSTDDTMTTIDPCNPNPCENNNTCIQFESSFTCDCKPRYGGKLCNEVLNLCYENPCENGGSCTIESDDFKCDCIKPYTGRKCEQEIATSPATPSTSFTINTDSTTNITPNSSNLTTTTLTTINSTFRSTTQCNGSVTTDAIQPTDPANGSTKRDHSSTVVSQSTIQITSSEEGKDSTKHTLTDNTTYKLTNHSDFESTTVNPNISNLISEEPRTITESTTVTKNEKKSFSTESASSKTRAETPVSSTDSTYFRSTITVDVSKVVQPQSSTITKSTNLIGSEEESTSTKQTEPVTNADKSTNTDDFKLTTLSLNISISILEESSTITESTELKNKHNESFSTGSSSSETPEENLISSTDPASISSTNTLNPNTIVSETGKITKSTNFGSSEVEKEFTKPTQTDTSTVKLTKSAEFVSSTVDNSILTSKKSNKITDSIASSSNEGESLTTKSASSTVNLVNLTNPISFEKTTKIVNPRQVSSTVEESNKITTESVTSTRTDDTVTKSEITSKETSPKTVAYICGGIGGVLGLLLLIASITYHLKRVKMRKQRQYFQRDDSSSMGSADSTSRLA